MIIILPTFFHRISHLVSYLMSDMTSDLQVFLLAFIWQKVRFYVAKKGKYRHNTIRTFQ